VGGAAEAVRLIRRGLPAGARRRSAAGGGDDRGRQGDGRRQRARVAEQPDADRRGRHAGVDAGDEGGRDLAAALARRRLVDLRLRADEGEAQACARQQRPGEHERRRRRPEGAA
jgi:hypothetical protein